MMCLQDSLSFGARVGMNSRGDVQITLLISKYKE